MSAADFHRKGNFSGFGIRYMLSLMNTRNMYLSCGKECVRTVQQPNIFGDTVHVLT